MSWIDDLHKSRVFSYETENGEIISGTIDELSSMTGSEIKAEPGDKVCFEGNTFTYAGFDNISLRTMTKVMYEKNGRKAYHIRDASGKNRYISKSKADYLKHGEIDGKKVEKKKYSAAPLRKLKGETK